MFFKVGQVASNVAADRFYFYCHETLKHARPGIVPAEMLIGIKTMKYYYTCILIRIILMLKHSFLFLQTM